MYNTISCPVNVVSITSLSTAVIFRLFKRLSAYAGHKFSALGQCLPASGNRLFSVSSLSTPTPTRGSEDHSTVRYNSLEFPQGITPASSCVAHGWVRDYIWPPLASHMLDLAYRQPPHHTRTYSAPLPTCPPRGRVDGHYTFKWKDFTCAYPGAESCNPHSFSRGRCWGRDACEMQRQRDSGKAYRCDHHDSPQTDWTTRLTI